MPMYLIFATMGATLIGTGSSIGATANGFKNGLAVPPMGWALPWHPGIGTGGQEVQAQGQEPDDHGGGGSVPLQWKQDGKGCHELYDVHY